MALLISLLILVVSFGAILLTLAICRASSQADEMVRRILEPGIQEEHAT
jgi:hypothetical protein